MLLKNKLLALFMVLNLFYQESIHAIDYVFLIKFAPCALALSALAYVKIYNLIQNKQIGKLQTQVDELQGQVGHVSMQVHQLGENTKQGFQQANQQLNNIENSLVEVGTKIDDLKSDTNYQFTQTRIQISNLEGYILLLNNKMQELHQENNENLQSLHNKVDELPTKDDLKELKNKIENISKQLQQLLAMNNIQQENLRHIDQQTALTNQNLRFIAPQVAIRAMDIYKNKNNLCTKTIENK